MTLGVLAVLAGSRRQKIYQAALLGMMLIPVLFYPANYYLHSIFILPLLATSDQDRRWYWVGLVLLGMSFSQYFSYLPRETKFLEWSYGLLIGYGESISTGHNSTGRYMIMLFRSVGTIAIMALFVIWYLSRDNQK